MGKLQAIFNVLTILYLIRGKISTTIYDNFSIHNNGYIEIKKYIVCVRTILFLSVLTNILKGRQGHIKR